MRALVLGATGHLGNAITRELLGRGWQVTATSRRPEPAPNLAGLSLAFASGEADDPDQLEAWIRGHDLVVDAAAPYAFRNPLHAVAVHEGRLRMRTLLDAVARERARFLYVSSFVTQERTQPLLEAARSGALGLLHSYFALKKATEADVVHAAREGLPAVIVNPTVCLGPWDVKPRELCLIPLALGGELPAASDHPLNVIDVRDVAATAVTAVEQQSFGEPIPLAGHNVTVRTLLAAVCRLGGAPPPPLSVPASVTALASYTNEAMSRIGLSPISYPSIGTVLLLEQRWQWPGPLQRRLGVRPTPLSRTLVDAIDWYGELGYLDARGADPYASPTPAGP